MTGCNVWRLEMGLWALKRLSKEKGTEETTSKAVLSFSGNKMAGGKRMHLDLLCLHCMSFSHLHHLLSLCFTLFTLVSSKEGNTSSVSATHGYGSRNKWSVTHTGYLCANSCPGSWLLVRSLRGPLDIFIALQMWRFGNLQPQLVL